MEKIKISAENIQKIRDGLEKYNLIKALKKTPSNEEFQRKFTGFYRVRRNEKWRKAFFKEFENYSSQNADFEAILKKLWKNKDIQRLEASFASKMLHTICDQKPIWDSIVVNYQLGIKTPVKKQKATAADEENRFEKIVEIYGKICKGYKKLIKSETGTKIIKFFDGTFGVSEISEIKKIDFILWAAGKENIILGESDLSFFK